MGGVTPRKIGHRATGQGPHQSKRWTTHSNQSAGPRARALSQCGSFCRVGLAPGPRGHGGEARLSTFVSMLRFRPHRLNPPGNSNILHGQTSHGSQTPLRVFAWCDVPLQSQRGNNTRERRGIADSGFHPLLFAGARCPWPDSGLLRRNLGRSLPDFGLQGGVRLDRGCVRPNSGRVRVRVQLQSLGMVRPKLERVRPRGSTKSGAGSTESGAGSPKSR